MRKFILSLLCVSALTSCTIRLADERDKTETTVDEQEVEVQAVQQKEVETKIVETQDVGAKDVVRFMNIPVDGQKSEMIAKLKKKGFEYISDEDILKGRFNDREVIISIVANNADKIWRIVVQDENPTVKGALCDRFNELCDQFLRNPKYVNLKKNTQKLPANEDIWSRMLVNNKVYKAEFYQKPEGAEVSSERMKDLALNKKVWFTIQRNYGDHFFVIFYDNEYNKSNGSDL